MRVYFYQAEILPKSVCDRILGYDTIIGIDILQDSVSVWEYKEKEEKELSN